ncbi:ribonuclease H-like domain-containing protein [Tanacetum coccineum]
MKVSVSIEGLKNGKKENVRFDTSAGNHVKEILLKLNLPDHRILKDGGEGCLPKCLLTQRFPPRLTELRAPECPYHFLRTTRNGYGDGCATALSPRPLYQYGRGGSYDEEEGDDEEEDEEMEESLDPDSVSEDAEDEGPTAEESKPSLMVQMIESRGLDDEGHSMECGWTWFRGGGRSQNRRDLPRDIPPDNVVVLSYGPSDAMHNPPYPLKVSQQTLVSFLREITRISIDFLTPSWLILKRFDTSAGNHVKEILLKLNLPDHRILKDGGEDCSLDNSPYYSSARLRIAFDPTKSSHYKLVDAGRIFYDIDIQIYSSETDKGSLCSDRFNYFNFNHFDSAIYWNDRLHWLETKNRQLMHYSLNIEDLDHPIMTTIPDLNGYVVPTGRVIATVSIKVPTGSSNAKFPYLKKDEYETWAMKMEYWIMNSDHNLWNIVLHGNSRKRTGRDPRGNIMILPPVTMEEQIAVQRETKARTILLQSLPEDHMADFHHLDDAKDIWLAVKARFGGNEESKKMRKSMLKQEFADFKISESEGLHKGYDRFQKVLSQLNQMQARPDNEDCNMKFLRALPPSWSQVAITLKTKGGLDFLSFDDLYNKLRTLEIDVKGGSSYDSRVPAAPTHSAFISAASTNSKWSTADSKCQPSSVSYTTTSSSADASGNVLENVLHSFVAESDPQQQITYEDFDQIGKLDLEELDIKWQMAMLSVRINRFEKKAGRKFKFNNKDAARFDKKKVRCYQCSELGHFARECTGKKVDSKTRYSQFKIKELDKSEEPKALVSVDSMLNWSDHESEDMEKGASEVYGMIAGYGDDAVIPAVDAADGVSTDGIFADGVFVAAGNGSDGVSVAAGVGADGVSVTSSDATDAETQFALMGLSPQAKIDNMNNKVKLEEFNARFDKWKESSKNLVKLINSSMSSRSKFGLGYGDTFGSDEVFDLSAPSIFDSSLKDAREKPLYDWFVKPVGMHSVPPYNRNIHASFQQA